MTSAPRQVARFQLPEPTSPKRDHELPAPGGIWQPAPIRLCPIRFRRCEVVLYPACERVFVQIAVRDGEHGPNGVGLLGVQGKPVDREEYAD